MDRLLRIGFEVAGHWKLDESAESIRPEIIRHAKQKNILYAFACDGAVMYVGKTVRTLNQRMKEYANPAIGQVTNVRINNKIKLVLGEGQAVDILALPDSGLMHYGAFHLNLAAALEDDIIRQLNPPWNGGRKEPPSPDSDEAVSPVETAQEIKSEFDVNIGSAYRRQGFFNVPMRFQQLFGADGEKIEIDLDEGMPAILGTINRRCNNGGSPRIMGGVPVKDWIQSNFEEGNPMRIEVVSPISIRLRVPR